MASRLRLAPGTDPNENLSVSIFTDRFMKQLAGTDRSIGMSSSRHQSSSRYMSQQNRRQTNATRRDTAHHRLQHKITEAMEDDINSREEQDGDDDHRKHLDQIIRGRAKRDSQEESAENEEDDYEFKGSIN